MPHPSRRPSSRLPWPVIFLVIAFATPPEVSVSLGGLRLSAYRVVLMAMLLPCLVKLFCNSAGKITSPDLLMLFHGCWATLALIVYAGASQGIESGGIYFVEAVGSYLIGRCYIRNAADFRRLVDLMAKVVSVMMCFAVVESITGNHFIRDGFRSVLGGPALPHIEQRLGLHRAFTSFDHPILYGIFCAGTFGFSYYATSRPRLGAKGLIRPGVAAMATFFSLSSGAFSALGVQIALVGWDRITRGVAYRWAILISSIGSVWALITLLSNRGPVKVFLTYFTFSPGTGYNRLRIWEYGSAEVLRHPLFGIGLGEWERPTWMVSSSMDNFWLATAVRYGLPAFLALAMAALVIAIKLAGRSNLDSLSAGSRTAWMISMVGLSLAGCTVHFWNALFCLFCFLMGTGAWLMHSSPFHLENRLAGPPYQNENRAGNRLKRRLK